MSFRSATEVRRARYERKLHQKKKQSTRFEKHHLSTQWTSRKHDLKKNEIDIESWNVANFVKKKRSISNAIGFTIAAQQRTLGC